MNEKLHEKKSMKNLSHLLKVRIYMCFMKIYPNTSNAFPSKNIQISYKIIKQLPSKIIFIA